MLLQNIYCFDKIQAALTEHSHRYARIRQKRPGLLGGINVLESLIIAAQPQIGSLADQAWIRGLQIFKDLGLHAVSAAERVISGIVLHHVLPHYGTVHF